MQLIILNVCFLLLAVCIEGTLRFCPISWEPYGAYCFKAISGNSQYNYDRANFACQNEGGRLASFHSSDELEYLRENLTPSFPFYIGLKRNLEGNWVYSDTSSFDYSNWDFGEPALQDKCAVVNTNSFKWSGETCHLTVSGALCRKPLDDRKGPEATCVNTTVEVPSSADSTPVDFVEPIILDESSPVAITLQSHRSGDVFQKGETRVEYTFQDGFSNPGNCSFFVIVKEEDTTPPTVNCFNSRSELVQLSSSNKTVYFTEPEASDASGPVTITFQSHKPGDSFEVGTTRVTYNYSDASGNSAGCTFTVTVERVDIISPSVTCVNFTDTVSFESPNGGKNVSFKEPKATDNSGQVNITSQSHHPGEFFEEGATNVVYTFSDPSGNKASCSFYVIVKRTDKIPPSVKCQDFTVEIPKQDQETKVHFEEPVVSDNSGHVVITSQSHSPGDTFSLGETRVTYSFSDESGNSETCYFIVEVLKEKDIAPELETIQKYVQNNKRTFTHDNVTQVSEELADFLLSNEKLNSDEVDVIADILSDVTSFNSSSPKVTSFVLVVADNIIRAEVEGEEVISENSSEIILRSLERQLENVREDGKNFSESGQNIAVDVVQLENFAAPILYANFEHDKNGTYEPDSLGVTLLIDDLSKEHDDAVVSIQLDPKALLSAFPSGQQTLPLSLIVYNSDALFQNSETLKSNLEVNSFVIEASTSVSISNLPKKSSVVATFLPKTKHPLGRTQCMFWNHTLHRSHGGWSGEGCYINESDTSELISCVCNHLTSFAILVNPYGDIDHELISLLTLVGCIISIVCLVITVVSLSASRNIRSRPPQKIIINLSLALLGLYTFFLIGVDKTDLQIGCIIFGVLIHFFLLSAIAWMSVEATNMYLMFIKVLNANVHHFLWKASVFAWGLPTVIVVTCAIVSPHSYSNGENCFPHHTSLIFYTSVFGIVALLLLYNLIIFFLVVWKLTCSRKKIASTSSNTRRDTIRRLQNAFAISVLLGTCWTFGLVPIKDRTLSLLFNILFCVFNSLQGCFIFLLFVLRQKDVRNTWRRWLFIRKSGDATTRTTGFSSQTDQGRFGDKKEKKSSFPDASPKTDVDESNTETKGL